MTHGTTHQPRTAGHVDLGDAELNQRISVGLGAVEELLDVELAKGEDFLVDKVMHLTKAGGKRFRPMMALLASEYGPHAGSENVVKAATVLELVHLATLYHDDVMDEADLRRGVPSANARWTNSVAILAGDILFAHASRLMSELDVATVAHFAQTFQDLVTGQMRETIGAEDGDPIEHYMKVIHEKTGVLIASAGHLGAVHGGASAEHVDALTRLGGAIGMIFQIVDDIIDIFSDPAESGKTPGTDLREGVFTLPVLYALAEDSPVGDQLRALLVGPLTTDEDVALALELLEQSTGRARALAEVQRYLTEAETQIARLPEGRATEALKLLTAYTMRRVG
ncbi:polyprenyl synthetase family protein [Corynebacterium testudinoris]|uniref:Geranylgeranyl pyrophosphate synthase n=1 Tax=Corynebacterium testudinoris TaxID=136857 RepID=A0A0G3H7K7_9CORY|nr:polyprenyl synthetase family protein [Corynebacterium testudinoris]AKK07823.1 geranylgeranyl pyrophosphate synthase [Corynebacterium testudinoris]MBX8997048.1 polyprenyl synthetase family protein [Corynebacterium testudinoris]